MQNLIKFYVSVIYVFLTLNQMDWQLVASHFTVKSTDILTVQFSK